MKTGKSLLKKHFRPKKEKKNEINPSLMHDTGCLGLVHWDDPEGWYGEGGGRGGLGWGTCVYLWQIHVDVWQNQYNIVK